MSTQCCADRHSSRPSRWEIDVESGSRYRLRRPNPLRMSRGFAGEIHPATDEVPGLDLAFSLERDRPSPLADELVLEQFLRRSGDLDPAWGPVGLHATRRVHRVAP